MKSDKTLVWRAPDNEYDVETDYITELFMQRLDKASIAEYFFLINIW